MSKKFLVPVSAAIAALATNNASATVSPVSNENLASGPVNAANSSPMSGSPIQSVEYVKNGEAHLLMMKKMDAGQVLAYHSSHASHASHSSHRSGR